jgi:hypothetical protein
MLLFLCPSLQVSDIPYHSKVRTELMVRAQSTKVKIKEWFGAVNGLISFTFDTWTSDSLDPYISVTAHYIVDTLNKWVLKTEQLVFTLLQGNHSRANIAKTLVCTLDCYDLCGKIGWWTANNATNKDTGIKAVAVYVNPNQEFFDTQKQCIRYDSLLSCYV